MSVPAWLARWFGAHAPHDAARWVVVDVETSGLDMRRDELLAVAALALRVDPGAAPRIEIGDSFEAVLRAGGERADKDNILLHGIGVAEQRAGTPAPQALAAFEQWLGAAPVVAWHAAFDRTMIGRAMQRALGRRLRNAWLDLAPVAGVLHPQVGGEVLDDWLAHFGIDCAARHSAAADCAATAELLLRLWPAARRRGCASYRALAQLERARRWLGRRA